MLTPCTVALTETEPNLSLYSMGSIDDYRQLGIYSQPSMNWEQDLVTICYKLDSFECVWSRFFTADYPGVVSSKALTHWD